MRLIISDRGNLGVALAEQCIKDSIPAVWYDEARFASDIGQDAVAVYVGGGRRFAEFLDFCHTSGDIPMLQCSSDVDVHRLRTPLPIADVNNAAESVAHFIRNLKSLVRDLHERHMAVEWKLSESHQRTKTSPPGTALRIAALLGIPPEKIHSVRRRDDRHSKHIVHAIVGDGHERYRLECEVLGLEPYARGIIKIARGFGETVRHSWMEKMDTIYGLDDFQW